MHTNNLTAIHDLMCREMLNCVSVCHHLQRLWNTGLALPLRQPERC